jgi:hypothetical protein
MECYNPCFLLQEILERSRRTRLQNQPLNLCVANRIINGTQHTVTWHIDNLKSSYVNPKVNNKFLAWLKTKYANDKIREIKAIHEKKHNYLAITLDFTTPEVLKINITSYVKEMLEIFPENLNGKTKYPWSKNLFKVNKASTKLPEDRMKIFHTFVMKGMFLCKQARQEAAYTLQQESRNPTKAIGRSL